VSRLPRVGEVVRRLGYAPPVSRIARWGNGMTINIPPERLAHLETAWRHAEAWSIARQVADPLHDDPAFLDHFEKHLMEEVVRGAVEAGRAVLTNTGPLWSVQPSSFAPVSEHCDFEEAAHGVEWTRGAPLPFASNPVWLMCRMSGMSIPLLPEEV